MVRVNQPVAQKVDVTTRTRATSILKPLTMTVLVNTLLAWDALTQMRPTTTQRRRWMTILANSLAVYSLLPAITIQQQRIMMVHVNTRLARVA